MSKLKIGQAICPYCGYKTTTGSILKHIKTCKKEEDNYWNDVIDEVLKHNAVNWHNIIPTLKKEFSIKRKG